MLGGGAGHIADMIARMRANKNLQLNRRNKRAQQLDKNSKPNENQPLVFKPTNEKRLQKAKIRYQKRRKKQSLIFVIITLLVLTLVFWLISLIG